MWLAGLNAFLSVYILWIFYKSMQYMPSTGAPPMQLTVILWILYAFECTSAVVCILYIYKKNVSLVQSLYGITLLQFVAVAITPFLIAATVMPRV